MFFPKLKRNLAKIVNLDFFVWDKFKMGIHMRSQKYSEIRNLKGYSVYPYTEKLCIAIYVFFIMIFLKSIRNLRKIEMQIPIELEIFRSQNIKNSKNYMKLVQIIVKFNTIYSKLSYISSKFYYFATKNSQYDMFFSKLKRILAKIENLGFLVQDNFKIGTHMRSQMNSEIRNLKGSNVYPYTEKLCIAIYLFFIMIFLKSIRNLGKIEVHQ